MHGTVFTHVPDLEAAKLLLRLEVGGNSPGVGACTGPAGLARRTNLDFLSES